jgi:hypothetical protein
VNDFSDLVRNTSFSRSGEFGQQKNQLREEEAKKELEEGKEEDASNQIHQSKRTVSSWKPRQRTMGSQKSSNEALVAPLRLLK